MRNCMWFRSDLRVEDNTALAEACRSATDGVVGVFVVCADQWRGHDYAPARVDLILRTLAELSERLAGLNIPLRVVEAARAGDVAGLVAKEAAACGCGAVFANAEYEVDETARDAAAARECAAAGLGFHLRHDQTAIEPATIRTGEGRFFSVFSPFRKAWLRRGAEEGGVSLRPAPGKQKPISIERTAVPARVKGFESRVPAEVWPGGERHALSRLRTFAKEGLEGYKVERDYPGRAGTSRISPYLTVGAVSTRQCVHAALSAAGLEAKGLDVKGHERMPAGPGHWVSEVVWREFFTHVLVGWPRVCMGRAFQIHTERLRWSENEEHFRAWCEGRTGVPIVDAGMRELLATGWMHNRVRMITAMFLTKNLFIDWRRGERFFMRNLVDGFLASNNGGWQWSASTGTDAAPYFRIFNPISQSEKFDPEGSYIRRWVEELRDVEGPAVHQPHDERKGLPGMLRMKIEYPEPIVDLSASRERAIAAFQALRA